jgi:hypothetical protein
MRPGAGAHLIIARKPTAQSRLACRASQSAFITTAPFRGSAQTFPDTRTVALQRSGRVPVRTLVWIDVRSPSRSYS